MARRAGIDTRALRDLVGLLRRGLTSDGDAEELFDALRVMFGCTGIVLGQNIDFRAWSRTEGVPEQWKADHSRLREQDPALARLLRSPAGTWCVAKRDSTPQQLRAEIFDRFHSAGFSDAAVGRVYNPFRDDLYVALYRDHGRFDPQDLFLLDLIYPHLAAGLASRRALDVLAGVAPFDAPALFVGFPEGRVDADSRARTAIERRTGKLTTLGWARVKGAIAAAARRFAMAEPVARSQVLWPGLRIDFAIVPPERGESLRLVGFLIDEDEQREANEVPALVDALLSPRQLDVARDFADGSSISTIAEARRLSPDTVRGYLRAAYERLGVRSRAELTRSLRS